MQKIVQSSCGKEVVLCYSEEGPDAGELLVQSFFQFVQKELEKESEDGGDKSGNL